MVRPHQVHVMGIAGSGASAAAAVAAGLGIEVSGCDLKTDSQYTRSLPSRIKIFPQHHPSHIQDNIDLLVVSPAILKFDPDNSELAAARQRAVPVLTWQQFVGRYLHEGKLVVAVAGSHGKSTTTAMIGHILEDAHLDPLVLIGAVDLGWQSNFRVGSGEFFVCEADEYYHNFWHYQPNWAVVTNIELDHPDFYHSQEEILAAFAKFIGNLQQPANLIVNPQAAGIEGFLKLVPQRVHVVNCQQRDYKLQVLGGHNLQNASLAACLAQQLGINERVIRSSLEQFKGVAQRLEEKGRLNKAPVYSDYAVHPTEVKMVLATLKQQYRNWPILAVFEPHTFSRLAFFLNDFGEVFSAFGVELIVTDVFAAREREGKVTPDDLVKRVKGAVYVPFEQVASFIKNKLRNRTQPMVVVVMGAGNAYQLVNALLTENSEE